MKITKVESAKSPFIPYEIVISIESKDDHERYEREILQLRNELRCKVLSFPSKFPILDALSIQVSKDR